MQKNIDLQQRKRALEALAAMPAAQLISRYADVEAKAPALKLIRGPEIGAIMLRGRVGGGGAPFNLGEASVTRASIKLESGEIGHSMILGRDVHAATAIAHLDALYQLPQWSDVIERDFIEPALELRDEARRIAAEEAEATKVDFFTVSRGEGQ